MVDDRCRSRAVPIERYLRVTGSLLADEQAEVSAELAGRVIATPVERGTRVAGRRRAGAHLRRRDLGAAAGSRGQRRRRSRRASGSRPGRRSIRRRVPDVMNAKASLDLAEAEFDRIQSLLDQKVVSQSECDQRRTQVEAARQQYKVAQNVAEQSYRSLQAARARVALARKSRRRHRRPRAVRRPRRRAAGQRRRLRHRRARRDRRPHRSAARRADRARAVRLADQGRPAGAADGGRLSGRGVHGDGALRVAVAPRRSARADGRSDRAERGRPAEARAVRDRADSAAGAPAPALLVPATAVETVAGTSRVYVVKDGKVEERIVTLGEKVGEPHRDRHRRQGRRSGRRRAARPRRRRHARPQQVVQPPVHRTRRVHRFAGSSVHWFRAT